MQRLSAGCRTIFACPRVHHGEQATFTPIVSVRPLVGLAHISCVCRTGKPVSGLFGCCGCACGCILKLLELNSDTWNSIWKLAEVYLHMGGDDSSHEDDLRTVVRGNSAPASNDGGRAPPKARNGQVIKCIQQRKIRFSETLALDLIYSFPTLVNSPPPCDRECPRFPRRRRRLRSEMIFCVAFCSLGTR